MAGSAEGPREGVVRYRAEHREEALPTTLAPLAATLDAWRHPLRALGLLGRDPLRYDGHGFGNLSARAPSSGGGSPPGRRPFLVTGSQTGGAEHLGLGGFALVERHDPAGNRLWSRGRVAASSESLTHAALYERSPGVGAVFHVHAPEPWRRRRELGLAVTDPAVPYGTPAMAAEVGRAWGRLGGPERGVLAMGGHEDGLLAWGPTPGGAGRALLALLLEA